MDTDSSQLPNQVIARSPLRLEGESETHFCTRVAAFYESKVDVAAWGPEQVNHQDNVSKLEKRLKKVNGYELKLVLTNFEHSGKGFSSANIFICNLSIRDLAMLRNLEVVHPNQISKSEIKFLDNQGDASINY
jgi:hypothetical protein